MNKLDDVLFAWGFYMHHNYFACVFDLVRKQHHAVIYLDIY